MWGPFVKGVEFSRRSNGADINYVLESRFLNLVYVLYHVLRRRGKYNVILWRDALAKISNLQ